MAARSPPSEPLVVILGSTGTGKSELAVELATRFRGEIINADAMQMYKGLPIITNKIIIDERRGIPHHLLDHIGLDQPTWDVDDFKLEANKVIREIRSRGNLPIVVGGTHYYTNALLFEDILVGPEEKESTMHPILQESTETILAKLKEVDPAMADRWHPNDRRKIMRSLEIYLNHGRPASEIYAEQRMRKTHGGSPSGSDPKSPWQSLLFWVYSDPEVLKDRLDKRIDKMLDNGLIAETQEMFEHLQARRKAGEQVDFTRGIWQSIGFKEFEPFLILTNSSPVDDAESTELKTTCLESMKAATRQYAKYQTRWIKTKVVPLLQEQDEAMDHLFVMDSTDISQWSTAVLDPAVSVARQFLDGKLLPIPADMSERAREVLAAAATLPQRTPCRRTCDICHTTIVTEEEWHRHIRGQKHSRNQRKTRRLAVAASRPMAVVPARSPKDDEGGESRLSSPDLSQLELLH